MKLRLRRIACKETYTIGVLEVLRWGNWERICNTIEDKVRDLNKDGDLNDEGEGKVYAQTAIPYGTYTIAMDVVSPKYSNFKKYPFYEKYEGKLPRLLDIKGFEGVLIHTGNTASDSAGCLIVGYNTVVGKVTNSKAAFSKLMDMYLLPAKHRCEEITISIE